MTKRKRYRDATSVGTSAICGYRKHETSRQRHKRRKQFALKSRGKLAAWCANRGLSLEVSNENRHWRIVLNGETIVQWWPPTAKCIVGRTVDGRLSREHWKSGIHVHDWKQLIKIIQSAVDV